MIILRTKSGYMWKNIANEVVLCPNHEGTVKVAYIFLKQYLLKRHLCRASRVQKNSKNQHFDPPFRVGICMFIFLGFQNFEFNPA